MPASAHVPSSSGSAEQKSARHPTATRSTARQQTDFPRVTRRTCCRRWALLCFRGLQCCAGHGDDGREDGPSETTTCDDAVAVQTILEACSVRQGSRAVFQRREQVRIVQYGVLCSVPRSATRERSLRHPLVDRYHPCPITCIRS